MPNKSGISWDKVPSGIQWDNVPENYGNRPDGTAKGKGYLGPLAMKDGSNKVATEISIGVNFDGKETQIPSLVPTLSEEQKNYLLSGGSPNDRPDIVQKAVEHAKSRLQSGQSVYSSNTAPGEAPKSDITTDTRVRRNPLFRLGTGVVNSILEPTRLAAEGLSAISKPGAPAEHWGQYMTDYMKGEQAKDSAAVGDDKYLYALDTLGSILSPASKIPTAKVEALVNTAKLPGYLGAITKGVGAGLIGGATTVGDINQSASEKLSDSADAGALTSAALHTLGKGVSGLGEVASRFAGGGYGIKEAYLANKQGGDAAKAFWDAKNGNIHPSEVVDELLSAKEVLDRARSKAYTAAKEPLLNTPYKLHSEDYRSIQNAITDAMGTATEFGKSVSPDVAKVKQTVQDILSDAAGSRGSGALPNTAGGLNYLRSSLNYYKDSLKTGGGLDAQKRVPAVIADELNNVMSKRIPGWAELQKDNALKEKTLRDIEKSLSLNDSAGTEAAINKLLKSLRSEFKGEMLNELQKYGPKHLVPKIAGLKTKDWMSQGLGQVSQMGSLGGALYYHNPALALLAGLQSPKVAGSIAGHLGATQRGIDGLLETLVGAPRILDQAIIRGYQQKDK